MKYKYFVIILAIAGLWAPSSHAATSPSVQLSAPSDNQPKKPRRVAKPAKPMPISLGSQPIEFKNKMKAEIRPDKSVWWFGVNYKKAIMADGTHELMDGQKITTQGGRLVGKMPKPIAVPKK